MKKILLFGYSRANLGDDFFVYMLAKKYEETEFYIHIKEEKYKKGFKNIENIHFIEEERNVDDVKIEEYDGFIYVGGSIFIESEYSYHEQREFHKFIVKCNENNKPFFYMTSNFGPYKSEEYLNLVKENIKICSGICFRDIKSYELFKEFPQVTYGPDMVFSYDFKDLIEKKERKSIGISVINLEIRENLKGKQDIYEDFIKRIIIKFVKRGYNVSLISFCEFEEDKKAIERIKKIIPNEYIEQVKYLYYEEDIEGFLREYSKIKYMVCTRFHSMIFSMLLGQKIYNMTYSKKQNNVIKDLNLFKKVQDIENLTFETKLKKYNFHKVGNRKMKQIKEKSKKQLEAFEKFLQKK